MRDCIANAWARLTKSMPSGAKPCSRMTLTIDAAMALPRSTSLMNYRTSVPHGRVNVGIMIRRARCTRTASEAFWS